MRAHGLLFLLASSSLVACDAREDDARETEVVTAMTTADEPAIRTRPTLSAGKYARMSSAPFSFFRGSLALYVSDWRLSRFGIAHSRFGGDAPLVPSMGDPHFENFGTLQASDGSLALEPNDFDGADVAPYLWDVRRLATSFALVARVGNAQSETARAEARAAARAIARSVAEGYVDGIARRERGETLPRVESGEGNPILEDLFRRSRRDAAGRTELESFAVLEGGVHRFRRGVLDPADPSQALLELPAFARNALPAALEAYRPSLVVPYAPTYFRVLDAVREVGSGVSSFARLRILVLVDGPTVAPEDDVILELKELADSNLGPFAPPGVFYGSVQERIRRTTLGAWARPDADPRWGVSSYFGFPAQVRTEADGQKTLRVSRVEGAAGTPGSLQGLGRILGRILARVHGASLADARRIGDAFAADPEGFADEQAEVADAYAAVLEADAARFARARTRLGALLGLPPESGRSPDLLDLLSESP